LENFSMKKTLIALAAVAAAGSVFAQANITGSMVLGVGTTKQGTANTGGQIVRQTGNLAFSGTEDLGGGLKASFRLETSIGGVATTVPGTAPNLGDRSAWMAVQGGFGTVLVGRAATGIRANFGAVGDVSRLAVVTGLSAASSAAVDASGVIASTAAGDASARVIYGDTFANQLAYQSPTINGFTVVVGTVFVDGNAANQKDTMSYGVNYAAGPLAVRFNITDNKRSAAPAYKLTTLNASYDFGVAKVGFTSQRTSVGTGVKPGSAYAVTANVPLSAAGSVGLGYGKKSASTADHAAVAGDDVKQQFIGYRHDLSKRTNVQVVYNKIDRAGTAADRKETHLLLGHSF
jgi:predicted porin